MTHSTVTSASERTKKIIKPFITLAFWAGVWAFAARRTGLELLLPSPGAVIRALGEMVRDGEFYLTVAVTLVQILAGFAAGVTAGTVLAVLTSSYFLPDTLFSPAVKTVGSIPVASFIIPVLLWVDKSRITTVISAVTVVPIVWNGVTAAISGTDAALLEMAKAYRFGKRKTLKYVYIPAVLPSWLGCCAAAMGMAWKSGIAAQVLCQPEYAVGTRLIYAKYYLETPSLFAWTLVVAVLSIALERLLKRFVKGRAANDRN